MKRKVRSRDGAIREVDDHYILLDGETYLVALPFMDANGRSIIHDGNGNPAGQRPGFLYGDGQSEQALVDAYAEYDDAISNRWRQDQQANTEAEPQAFDSKEAALAAAYLDYEQRIRERWRK